MEFSLLAFALVSLVVVMAPGPTVLLSLSNGSRYGLATAGYGIAGAAISDFVLIAAAALGLGALLMASAFWFAVVKWIGAAYLIWVGAQMLRTARNSEDPTKRAAVTQSANNLRVFSRSFLVAVTNPKGYLFFAALLPQFLDPAEPLVSQYMVLALTFVTIDALVMTVYAGMGARATRALNTWGSIWIDRCSGGLLVLLGCTLGLVRRGEL